MLNGKRTHLRFELRDSAQRNKAASRRSHVEAGKVGRLALEILLGFQNDPVLVRRRVDGGDLPRAVGAAQGALDLARADAEARSLVTVDVDKHLRARDLKIRGDIHNSRNLLHPVLHSRRGLVEDVEVGSEKGELVETLCQRAADADGSEGSEGRLSGREYPQDPCEAGGSSHRSGGRSVARFERQKSRPALPELALLPPPIRDMNDSTDGFLRDDLRGRLLEFDHPVKRDALLGLRGDQRCGRYPRWAEIPWEHRGTSRPSPEPSRGQRARPRQWWRSANSQRLSVTSEEPVKDGLRPTEERVPARVALPSESGCRASE